MCSNSGAMGVRRARSNTRNEPSHAPALALLRTSDLVMSSCVGSLNDVHGPLNHERHAASSLQGARALILGQPPSAFTSGPANGVGDERGGDTKGQPGALHGGQAGVGVVLAKGFVKRNG